MNPTTKTKRTCGKCGGNGAYVWRDSGLKDVCYGCDGTGIAKQRKAARSPGYKTDADLEMRTAYRIAKTWRPEERDADTAAESWTRPMCPGHGDYCHLDYLKATLALLPVEKQTKIRAAFAGLGVSL